MTGSQLVLSEATPKQLRKAVERVFQENVGLRESLTQVNHMLKIEDQGWLKLGSNKENDGLTLEDMRKWSGQIREAIVGNPHIKRGIRLRATYVFDGGVRYSKLPSGQGKGKNVKAFVEDPQNVLYFFSNDAREQRETACYSDGVVFTVGRGKDKILETVPLWEITDDFRNPNKADEIWAYRRSWTYVNEDGKGEAKHEWIFTDVFAKKRGGRTHFEYKGSQEPVAVDDVIFDGHVNGQVGWGYGAADAIAALVWARLYRDFLVNGKIMSDALAQFAFQTAPNTKKSGDNQSIKYAAPGGVGQTVVGNTLVPISSAGKGYDFDSGRALLAAVATAIEVSVVGLSSDPGAAGSSYGSASNLDLPTKLMVSSRRQWHADYERRVLSWGGAPSIDITFKTLESATDIFRQLQAIVLLWSTGLYSAAETRAQLDEAQGKKPGTPPKGVLLPNNEASLPDPATAGGEPTPSAPGQGKASPAGKAANTNDQRTDGVGESLIARFEALIAEAEASIAA